MTIHPWSAVGRTWLTTTPVAATIGVFDGVHRGHQSLLAALCQFPDRESSLVVTFRDNPKKLLNPAYPGDLMTWDEKARTLEDLGVGHVVVIDFSPTFSRMAGRDFFTSLKRSFVFSRLVLGWDFSFGKNSATTAADLGWLADPETRLTVLPPYQVDGQIVSSSAVRDAILGGHLGVAQTLLGRPYALPLGPPFRWSEGLCFVDRGQLGKLLPPEGSYPARLDGQRTTVTVEKNGLTWESPPGLRFQELVFV